MFILLRVHDKKNKDDAELDAQCKKAGDVVHIYKSGEQMGKYELTRPHWRIIIDESMTDLVAEALTESGVFQEKTRPRAATIDLKSKLIDTDFRKYLMDDSRTQPFYKTDVPLRLLVKQKFNRAIK